MQAGQLKNTITIKRDTSDGTAGQTWEILFSGIRAKKDQASGRLYYAAAASQSENQVIYTIRYCTGIRPTMQVIDTAEPLSPYEIVSDPIDIENAHQWLELHCVRVDANGGN